jgi:ATP-dependent helicase/nuclease subunit A
MTKGTADKKKVELPDDSDRQAAVHERARDVIVLAGAGSGKTTILAKRFVEMVAPEDDLIQAIDIRRLAAVTFTRRAAGELKNRIRSRLLLLLGEKCTKIREERIETALSLLDFSLVGTIHSFADRLLRLRPIEAQISPRYAVVEQEDALITETVQRWHEGSRSGNLTAQWLDTAQTPGHDDLKIAIDWLKELESVGVRTLDYEWNFQTKWGLEGLVRGWVGNRDKCPPFFPAIRTDVADIRSRLSALKESLIRATQGNIGWTAELGCRHLVSCMANIGKAIQSNSPSGMLSLLNPVFANGELKKGTDFSHAPTPAPWKLYKQLSGAPNKGDPNLREEIYIPLLQSLLAPAAKVYPVILSLHDDVKRRHEVVDQTDLLIRLRDVLKNDSEVQASLADRFDHIFVDEFQDTDPVQAEILLSLCRRKGSLTVIGDPKQSIYRFRGADIGQFDRAVKALKKRGALVTELTVNFRSRPELIDAFNAVFSEYFGPPSAGFEGETFIPETGWVAYSPLVASPYIAKVGEAPLRILRLDALGAERAPEGRPLEARLVARHIAWLLRDKCPIRVRDGTAALGRQIVGADIAILARAMTNVGTLVRELRDIGVEVHVSGGREYASNPLLQRYIFALSAVADSSDGIGLMALHLFPFSSVTPFDSATQKHDDSATPEGALTAWLKDLRIRRNQRPVLHTALDLIDSSLALRVLGLGTNGDEDLATLYRFANLFDDEARKNGWDFDETARWARSWIDNPPQVNAPAREGNHSVQVLTVHQSKGLEFPVVILFDGFGIAGKDRGASYRISPTGDRWALSIGDYSTEFSLDSSRQSLSEHEEVHVAAEQKRLQYVASTRAMDYLIVPVPEPSRGLYRTIWGNYLNPESVLGHVSGPIKADANADFLVDYRPMPEWLPTKEQDLQLGGMAENPIYPVAIPSTTVTAESKGDFNKADSFADGQIEHSAAESGGMMFGTAVHRAVSLVLMGALPAKKACEIASAESESDFEMTQLEAHVGNVIMALEGGGYLDGSWKVLSEVPFAQKFERAGEKKLLRGVIDLLLIRGSDAKLIDFKSDSMAYFKKAKPQYLKQLGLYRESVLKLVPAVKTINTALLLSATGEMVPE